MKRILLLVNGYGSNLRLARTHALILLGFALMVAAQRFGASIFGFQPSSTQAVDALMVLANTFAIICCIDAILRFDGISRRFWVLFGSALTLQLCGNLGWTYVTIFNVRLSETSIFPSLFYRLYAGPMAIALFLSEGAHTSRLKSFLDGCIVVGLVGLTMYQLQIAEMSAHDPKIWRSITFTTSVNVVLFLAAMARFVLSPPDCLRSLFARQVIYLSTYLGVSVLTSIADAYFPRISESTDCLWIVTYLVAAVLSATWHPPAETDTPPPAKISRRSALLCFNLTLATLVLASAVLGLRLVNSTRVVGLVGVGVVLFSFAIRSALMQDSQEKTLAELQESRAELNRQALYDELTGLPNRRLLSDRLCQALAIARRDRRMVALLYIDLDGFKPVNDRLGHAIGDLLLVEAARRMQSRAREADTVARMGGDEFTLLMTIVTAAEQAGLLARDILHVLGQPYELEAQAVAVTASIGIALFPDDALDASRLIENADRAMYSVKRQGKNGVSFYVPGLDTGLAVIERG